MQLSLQESAGQETEHANCNDSDQLTPVTGSATGRSFRSKTSRLQETMTTTMTTIT